ncbi:gastrin/cholecystokinin-like peptide [Microcaecilia unicolor]|uniref:Gastrin/cholecystokinin-like peptide n=1 Tax=Microcaecilia unicolor TaxID=1415580 RepID=A0A6P7ZUV9_9AMPH|nr:gastrin/cholecystokinin-like peptide [Microcaecilia unicolor]
MMKKDSSDGWMDGWISTSWLVMYMTSAVWLSFLIAMLATTALSRHTGGVHKPEASSIQRESSKRVSFEPARRDLESSPSQEQILFVSRFLCYLFLELSNKDEFMHENSVHPIKGQDYGWMDFGRRSTEDRTLDV